MEGSEILGQIIGLYLAIVGVSMLARQQGWMAMVKDMRKNESFGRLVALFELLLGVAIVMLHNVWVQGWEVAITIIGWIMLIEGAAYLLLPHSAVEKKIKAFNKPGWYVVAGIVTLVVGLYLLGITFGVFTGV